MWIIFSEIKALRKISIYFSSEKDILNMRDKIQDAVRAKMVLFE